MDCQILVVDDHVDTVQMMSRLLKGLGYRVEMATSCETARGVADGFQWNVDVLICDVGLPDGNGLELMGEFKGRCGCYTVAVTGFGTNEDSGKPGEVGVDWVLIKPVTMEGLKGVIERACERGKAQQEANG